MHLASYLNKDQYNFFKDSLEIINGRMIDYSIQIDEIESKLIEINKNRKQRRKQNDANLKNMFKQGFSGPGRKVSDQTTKITDQLKQIASQKTQGKDQNALAQVDGNQKGSTMQLKLIEEDLADSVSQSSQALGSSIKLKESQL